MTIEKEYFFERALLANGWQRNVSLSISSAGIISDIKTETECSSSAINISGTAIPGIPNAHSHAFQRAMAGLAEHKVSHKDSFWTWRQTMYKFAKQISADDLYNIASQLYVEMVKAGYTSVAEFHYVHHQADGNEYPLLQELSNSILNAATEVGIGLTHLPVLYMNAGFQNKPLQPEQLRFGCSVDRYLLLLESLNEQCSQSSNRILGMAFHSLRAVPAEIIKEVISSFKQINATGPIHIHIAEQILEVEQCIEWCGKRPVEWLLENIPVDERWCLIHATHLTKDEMTMMARSGAVAGLCPSTEANLGDGIFPLQEYLALGGNIAIGSDGNMSINPIEEMRWLEYVQRLIHQGRNIAIQQEDLHTGHSLYENCLRGGTKALRQNIGKLEKGYRADILILDDEAPSLAETADEFVLDTLLFSGNQPVIKDVMIAGVWQVENYYHRKESEIKDTFIKTMKKLRS